MTRAKELDERLLRYLDALSEFPESQWSSRVAEDLADDPTLREAVMGVLRSTRGGAALPPVEAMLAPGARDEPLPESVGPYRVTGRIGAGGMGVVLRALDPESGEPRALKLLPMAIRQDARARQRFEHEIEALQRLDHPHIVPILDWGLVEDGSPYLVMEEIHGEDLQSRLDREEGPLPTPARMRERVQLLSKVAAALEHAHARGVVHRDLKPANILVDEEGLPRLVDFGVAHLADGTRITLTGAAAGSPAYMAPEQLRGEMPCTPAVDVYGLGATLYHCLAGRPPFEGPSLAHMAETKRRHDPVPLRRVHPAVPADLARICERALAYRRADRTPDMSALREDLEAVLDFRSIRARALGPWTRTRRRFERRPVLSLALAAAAAVLLVLAGMGWREQRNRQLSELRVARSVAESLHWHAQLEGQAGNHERALELCDLALEAGAPDPMAVEIARVHLLERSLRSREAAEVLRSCLEAGIGGPHEAELRMLDAYLRAGPAPHEMWRTQRLREQLPHLEPADRAFAEAVLAPTIAESLARVEECLSIAPFHALAADLQTNLMLISGRIAGATANVRAELRRFPNDPAIRLRMALCLALEGDEAGLASLMADQPLDPSCAGMVDFAIGAGRARRLLESHQRDELLGREGAQVTTEVGKLVLDSIRLMGEFRAAPDGEVNFRLTPAILGFFAVPFARVTAASLPRFDPEKVSEALSWASEQSGDPHWYFIAGLGWREAALTPQAQVWPHVWSEAARYFTRACEVSSSLLSSAGTRRLYLIEACARAPAGAVDPQSGRPFREIGREAIGKVLNGAVDEAEVLRFLHRHAVLLQDPGLALRVGLRWQEADPGDSRATWATKLGARELLAAD